MPSSHPAKTLAWVGAGAALLAAGFLLSPSTRRRRRPEPLPSWDSSPDLSDRPVAAQALAEGLAAAQRVDALSGAVAHMETRLAGLELNSSAERLEAVWQKIARIEEQIAQLRAERLRAPSVEVLSAHVQQLLEPQIARLEGRLREHDIAIGWLREQASRTETSLQETITAVEKLDECISSALVPAAYIRGAAGPVERRALASETPRALRFAAVPLESYMASQRPAPYRWRTFLTTAAAFVSMICF